MIKLKAEIHHLTPAEYVRQFGITVADARENESRLLVIIEAIKQRACFVLKHGGVWLGHAHPDEWYGPMPLDEAQRLCAEINSTPNFAAEMERTEAYKRLDKILRKTRTPEYRAAQKKQNDLLKDLDPTPYPPIRLKPPNPDDNWVAQLTAVPEPLTQEEITDYQRIDRERKIRHMTAKRNRAKQPGATAAKARKAAERADLGRQMRAQGATNSAIANALSITVRQVQRLLKK